MKSSIYIEDQAERLPEAWDQLSEYYFQRRDFLLHTEKFNPCRQRYYGLYQDGQLKACAVAYTLQLDLLTFLRIPSPLQMHIIGIPCSVSCPGIFGAEAAVLELKQQIYQREKGFCLFLNSLKATNQPEAISGATLPTVVFQHHFSSWEAYIAALRTSYRRRLNKILEKGKELSLEYLPCTAFTAQMYEQYLQVFHHSKDKLEKLDLAFFQHLPAAFQLIVARRRSEVLGWVITLSHEDQYYFFLGGIDYAANRRHETYFYLLTAILKDGITEGAKYIDLGQTAEIPKMRLGGQCQKRYLEGRHHNGLVRYFLRAGQSWLVYRRKIPETHVFSNQKVPSL